MRLGTNRRVELILCLSLAAGCAGAPERTAALDTPRTLVPPAVFHMTAAAEQLQPRASFTPVTGRLGRRTGDLKPCRPVEKREHGNVLVNSPLKAGSVITAESQTGEQTRYVVARVEYAPLDQESDAKQSRNPASVPAPALADEWTVPQALPDHRPVYPTDFGSALMTAGGQNPRIAFAHGRIQEAFAQLDQAEVLWLPSIRVGTSYNRHDGTIQDVGGQVFDVSRSSTYQGFGARAVGAGSPVIPGLYAEFHLADAYIQPKIAGQVAAARNHAATATTNDVLLDTALAYLELLETHQLRAIAAETLGRATELAELTTTFAEEGEAPQADADRARTELTFRQNDIEQATEAVNVASARLAQLLSIDAGVCISPQEPTIVPIELVSCESSPHELVATGLSNRHEVAESRHLVAAACERLRREKTAPLVPSVILGMSYGGFGGGRNDFMGNYDDRFDLDAVAYWEVRNLGFGEKATRDEAAAKVQQAQATVVRQMDQVAREIVEAHAQVQARRRQIAVAQRGIESAEDANRRDLERIEAGQGLPIEALQSLQALDAARREYLRTVVDYNEAQFRLHRALGWPVQL